MVCRLLGLMAFQWVVTSFVLLVVPSLQVHHPFLRLELHTTVRKPFLHEHHFPCVYGSTIPSVLSKVLEKYIHGVIMDHLQGEHFLSSNQWGFRTGKSTVVALLGKCHNWVQTLEEGKEVEAVFFDFKKSIRHSSSRITGWQAARDAPRSSTY